MSGRPDYDAGDLVVCVLTRPGNPRVSYAPLVVGKVYRAAQINFEADFGWTVRLQGHPYASDTGRHYADLFRRIDPKPPSFWTGTVSADAGERVTA